MGTEQVEETCTENEMHVLLQVADVVHRVISK